MSNIHFSFEIAWLLLLLVPAVALALWPYFRVSRKYRRTRNRITSIILHLVVMVLTVSVLAGFKIHYDMPNKENEIILLVDYSHSTRESKDRKDKFVQSVLNETDEIFKVAILTFGRDVVEAVPFTYDTTSAFLDYIAPQTEPDDSATDYEKALTVAASMFSSPESGKIVLISDGIETDGYANEAIMRVAAEGIRVDTVYVPEDYDSEVLILDASVASSAVLTGIPVEFKIKLESSYVGEATLTVIDKGETSAPIESEPVPVTFKASGDNEMSVWHTFDTIELHRMTFRIDVAEGDTLTQNNSYHTYVNIVSNSKILVVDGKNKLGGTELGDGSILKILQESSEYTEVNRTDVDQLPNDASELVDYDEIILVNVANEDLPEGVDLALTEYVEVYGGGLFTVGGDKAYGREDMAGSEFQKLLPVEAVDYTPPIALVILIDRSASMSQALPQYANGGITYTKLGVAKRAASDMVSYLTDRDRCAVVTLANSYDTNQTMTIGSDKTKINKSIESIKTSNENTVYINALRHARSLLFSVKDEVEYMRLVILSDGAPSDEILPIESELRSAAQSGITISTAFIGGAYDATKGIPFLKRLAAPDIGNGSFFSFVNESNTQLANNSFFMSLAMSIESLQTTKDNIEDFIPKVYTPLASHHAVSGVYGNEIPMMNGFYGVRVKRFSKVPVEAPLQAMYSMPLYAEWTIGKGRVGSFMSDLNGNGLTKDFMKSEVGKRFIHNVVKGLLPQEDIRPQEITADLYTKNYSANLTISAKLNGSDNFVTVDVTDPDGNVVQYKPEMPVVDANTSGINVVSGFQFNQPGIYKIYIAVRTDMGLANGIKPITLYAAFSYSMEYYVFTDPSEGAALMALIAKGGSGGFHAQEGNATLDEMLSAASGRIVESFSITIPKVYDPMIPFIIIAVVLFLLDIAVRKFKFKWPWEIVRDNRLKKEIKHQK